ncbi:MAG: hypothetical protein J6K37_06750 [Lachnospiraceae bacterium]|nr:hypothetical protein [Lachnospiraceae bacterium]
MIIEASRVNMSSNRQYVYYEQKESISMSEKAGQAVQLDLSKEAKSLSEQMIEYQKEQKEKQQQQQQQNLQDLLKNQKAHEVDYAAVPESEEDWKVKMLRDLLEALKAMQKGRPLEAADKIKQIQSEYKQSARSVNVSASSATFMGAFSVANRGVSVEAGSGQNALVNSNKWTRTTVTSAFVSEMENTAFQTTGVARTKDGREINFGVTVEMSRAFCAEFESFTQEDYVVTDPLMINLDSNVANITDMKFMFDIDADGHKEEVSLAGKGSGFLALDKNGDGKINDGSELFGTKSGDGFKDLAAYDEDGNGWIDEADSIFKKLKVWSKDENGKDILISLKKVDVGAIYLGNANTEFSMKSGIENQTDAIIRKTGVYLKESGGVGTVQHVDLAV